MRRKNSRPIELHPTEAHLLDLIRREARVKGFVRLKLDHSRFNSATLRTLIDRGLIVPCQSTGEAAASTIIWVDSFLKNGGEGWVCLSKRAEKRPWVTIN